MTLKTFFAILLSIFPSVIYAQEETIKVDEKMTELLTLIDHKDMDGLIAISTKKMYCLLCFEKPKNKKEPYLMNKNRFYKKHFNKVFNDENLKRIKRGKKIILTEKSEYYDYIVLFTTYKRNELSEGHEGVQFGFWFKEVKGELKFAGIETIP